ncbi:hypothetical protein ABK046_21710 [Streptomyces caeruleatus]
MAVVTQQEHRGVVVGWPAGVLGEVRPQRLQSAVGVGILQQSACGADGCRRAVRPRCIKADCIAARRNSKGDRDGSVAKQPVDLFCASCDESRIGGFDNRSIQLRTLPTGGVR